MQFEKYSGLDLFKIKRKIKSSFNNEVQTCEFPFDLDFIIAKKQMGLSCFNGPGIYSVTYKKNVIYIGSYSPKEKGNIIVDRWKKHIMTMTNRGYRIGFSAKTKRAKIPSKFKLYFERDCKFRYSDTGTVTTLERLNFAETHEYDFEKKSINQSIISEFEFFYMRLHGNKIFSSEPNLKDLENRLIMLFRPKCNYLKNDIGMCVSEVKIKLIENKINEFLRK